MEDLGKDLKQEDLAENLATYFSSISGNFSPLDRSQIPKTFDRDVTDITEDVVADRLRSLRKPSSCVEIDLLAKCVAPLAASFAVALTPIINHVRKQGQWPGIWKREEGTVIPKSGAPTEFDQCRLISCTLLFSKLCEGFLLDQLTDARQFGRTKHLLVKLVTDQLDDNRACTTLISIDLEKAFNKMCHMACLNKLAERGASNQTLSMVAAFLEHRKMRVKLPGLYSGLKNMPGGAPQGTQCGNFLFCVTISDLYKGNEGSMDSYDSDDLGLRNLADRLMLEEDSAPSSPLGGRNYDVRQKRHVLRIYDSSKDEEERERTAASLRRRLLSPPPRWSPSPCQPVLFIDDPIGLETCDTTCAESLVSTKKELRSVHAYQAQALFRTVVQNAQKIGMSVNPHKTQLLCTSTAINSDIRSHIYTEAGRIDSGDTLKTVGFIFDRRPGAAEHIKAMRRKFGTRAGMLRHLKKIGIEEETLVEVYKSFIRPILEYACSAWHTILTKEQDGDIERLQRIALKIIHGLKCSYRVCLECSGLPRLDQRRETLFVNFTKKTYESARFSDEWFPRHQPSKYGLRRNREVTQEFANRDRLLNAPIFLG